MPESVGYRDSAKAFISLTLIVLACLLMGYLATEMNRFFYSKNQPFYDSLSYHRSTHHVMTTSRESGLPSSASLIWQNQTVCLPFLIAAVAGLFVEPSRATGIWIQVGELVVLCGSLWFYFFRVRNLSAAASVFATLPFLLMQCLYKFIGGLSDYRMDLSLMLLFGASCIWYLIALRSSSYRFYIILGLCLGATCLFRATAPIYLILTLGPLALFDCILVRRDRQHFMGLALASVVGGGLCLWFYMINFEYLYYYYVIWNTDANAKLPISESQKHLSFVVKHIGGPAFCYLVVFHFVVFWARLQEVGYSLKDWRHKLWSDLKMSDWRPLWLGLVPALFLVFRGAGLNPFVCMPAAVGIYLFCLLPVAHPRGLRFNPAMLSVLFISLAICWTISIRSGWKNHRGDSPDSMAAHQATLDAIVSDCKENGRQHARFAVTHAFFLQTQSLESVAIFDRPASRFDGHSVRTEEIELQADATYSVVAEADWNSLQGNSRKEKLDYLVTKSEEQIDYLIVPTAQCAEFLEKEIPYNVINRHASELRERLLANGVWVPIHGEIRNRDDEIVQVYRNRLTVPARLSSTMHPQKSSH